MPTWPSRIKICAKIDLALSFKLLCWGKPVFSVWFKTANHWKSGLLIIELRLKLFTTYSTQNNILFYTNLLLNASPVFIWARSPLHFQKYSTDSICSFFLKGSAILSLHAFFFRFSRTWGNFKRIHSFFRQFVVWNDDWSWQKKNLWDIKKLRLLLKNL